MVNPVGRFDDQPLTHEQVPSSSSDFLAYVASARSPGRRHVKDNAPPGTEISGSAMEAPSTQETKFQCDADNNVEIVPQIECKENPSDSNRSRRSRPKASSHSRSCSRSRSRSRSGRDGLRSRPRSRDAATTARTSGHSAKGIVSSSSCSDKRISRERSKSRSRRQTRSIKFEKEAHPSKTSSPKKSQSATTVTISGPPSSSSPVCVGETTPPEESILTSAIWRRNDQRRFEGHGTTHCHEDSLPRRSLHGLSRRSLASTRKVETSSDGKNSRKCSLSYYSNHARVGRNEQNRPSTNMGKSTEETIDGLPSPADKEKAENANIGASLSQSNHSHGGHHGDRRRRSSKPLARTSGEGLSNRSGHNVSCPSNAKVSSSGGRSHRHRHSSSRNLERDTPGRPRSRSRNGKRRSETKTNRNAKPHRSMSCTSIEEKTKNEMADDKPVCSDADINESNENCAMPLSYPIREPVADIMQDEPQRGVSCGVTQDDKIKLDLESKIERSPQETCEDDLHDVLSALPFEANSRKTSGLFSRMMKSFSSILDEATVVSEVASTAKVTFPVIFGHFNRSMASITTHDLDGTLAPYFSRQHDATVSLNSDSSSTPDQKRHEAGLEMEAEVAEQNDVFADWPPLEFSNTAPETYFPTKFPSTLDSLLDSKPRKFTSTLAEPSICSSCPNSPLGSKSKPNPFSDPPLSMTPTFEPALEDMIQTNRNISSSRPLRRIQSVVDPPSVSSDLASAQHRSNRMLPVTLSRPLYLMNNNLGGAGKSKHFDLFEKKSSNYSDDAVAFDISGNNTVSNRNQAASRNALAHVKLHKGASVAQSTPSTETPVESKYLQLDFASMGKGTTNGGVDGSPTGTMKPASQNCPSTAPARTRHAVSKDFQKISSFRGQNSLFPTPPIFGRNAGR